MQAFPPDTELSVKYNDDKTCKCRVCINSSLQFLLILVVDIKSRHTGNLCRLFALKHQGTADNKPGSAHYSTFHLTTGLLFGRQQPAHTLPLKTPSRNYLKNRGPWKWYKIVIENLIQLYRYISKQRQCDRLVYWCMLQRNIIYTVFTATILLVYWVLYKHECIYAFIVILSFD